VELNFLLAEDAWKLEREFTLRYYGNIKRGMMGIRKNFRETFLFCENLKFIRILSCF